MIFLLLGTTSEVWVDIPDLKRDSVRWRASTAFADTSLLFLAATLSIGPVRVLRGGAPIRHRPWRRWLGVTSALLGFAHLLIGFGIHGKSLKPWYSFLERLPTSSDPFPLLGGTRGFANYIGLLMLGILFVLVGTSNTTMMRRLKAVRWKTVQRLSYVLIVAVGVHALLYQIVEERLLLHRLLVLGVVVATIALQLTAAVALRSQRRSR